MIVEDICATLALPTGLLEVQVALTCEPTNKYPKLLRNRGQGVFLVKQGQQKLRKWLKIPKKMVTMDENSKQTFCCTYFRHALSAVRRAPISL